MKVIRYNISNRSEECQCPVCGFGLFIEDHAFEILPGDGGEAVDAGYCSRTCANSAILKLNAPEPTPEPCNSHGDDDCPACKGQTV